MKEISEAVRIVFPVGLFRPHNTAKPFEADKTIK
jgi:hypothetical protein